MHLKEKKTTPQPLEIHTAVFLLRPMPQHKHVHRKTSKILQKRSNQAVVACVLGHPELLASIYSVFENAP